MCLLYEPFYLKDIEMEKLTYFIIKNRREQVCIIIALTLNSSFKMYQRVLKKGGRRCVALKSSFRRYFCQNITCFISILTMHHKN